MKKDQTVFICMHVCAFVSFPYCLCRKKNGNMNGTEQNSATSSAASETGNGTGAGTGENGMNGDTASGWGEGENGTMIKAAPMERSRLPEKGCSMILQMI